MRLRLAPEWQCWPLWDAETGDNVDPADLPIPLELRIRIDVWDNIFQNIYIADDPLASDFESPEAEKAYIEEGRAIATALAAALGCPPLETRL